MFAYEIVKPALEMINAEQIITMLDERETALATSGVYVMSAAAKRMYNMVMRAVSFAISRASTEYHLFSETEELTSSATNEIAYGSFSKQPCEIVSVTEKSSNRLAQFFAMPDHLYVPKQNTNYEIHYKYVPQAVTTYETQIDIPYFVVPRILAYAVASDLCLSYGRFDESVIWNNRFKESMEKAIRGGSPKKVYFRKFF